MLRTQTEDTTHRGLRWGPVSTSRATVWIEVATNGRDDAATPGPIRGRGVCIAWSPSRSRRSRCRPDPSRRARAVTVPAAARAAVRSTRRRAASRQRVRTTRGRVGRAAPSTTVDPIAQPTRARPRAGARVHERGPVSVDGLHVGRLPRARVLEAPRERRHEMKTQRRVRKACRPAWTILKRWYASWPSSVATGVGRRHRPLQRPGDRRSRRGGATCAAIASTGGRKVWGLALAAPRVVGGPAR